MSEPIKVILAFGEQEKQLLIERVKLAPSREWIDVYFDLMACLIEGIGLENGDPRLVTSIPSTKYSVPMLLPVSTNNRYALAPDVGHKHSSSHVVVDGDFLSKMKDDYLIGIIYGAEFENLPEGYKRAQVAYYDRFEPLMYEKSLTPFFLRLKDPKDLLMPGPLQTGWISAALAEIERSKGSPYQKHHRPVVYKAAMNREFRRMILDKAFSSG